VIKSANNCYDMRFLGGPVFSAAALLASNVTRLLKVLVKHAGVADQTHPFRFPGRVDTNDHATPGAANVKFLLGVSGDLFQLMLPCLSGIRTEKRASQGECFKHRHAQLLLMSTSNRVPTSVRLQTL
jgi:hypothetical protein